LGLGWVSPGVDHPHVFQVEAVRVANERLVEMELHARHTVAAAEADRQAAAEALQALREQTDVVKQWEVQLVAREAAVVAAQTEAAQLRDAASQRLQTCTDGLQMDLAAVEKQRDALHAREVAVRVCSST
jgi:uncharacterized protein involved in exopolysaccharide biosynthesis